MGSGEASPRSGRPQFGTLITHLRVRPKSGVGERGAREGASIPPTVAFAQVRIQTSYRAKGRFTSPWVMYPGFALSPLKDRTEAAPERRAQVQRRTRPRQPSTDQSGTKSVRDIGCEVRVQIALLDPLGSQRSVPTGVLAGLRNQPAATARTTPDVAVSHPMDATSSSGSATSMDSAREWRSRTSST